MQSTALLCLALVKLTIGSAISQGKQIVFKSVDLYQISLTGQFKSLDDTLVECIVYLSIIK